MEKLKVVPNSTVNKIRNNPDNYGLSYHDFGKSSNIVDYSEREIIEMFYGIYKDQKILLVDDGYFLDLKEVNEIVCELEDVTYFRKPTDNDLRLNSYNSIRNIRTFYVKDYFLITKNEISGVKRHQITQYLYKIGAINKGRGRYANLYSCSNHYKILQDFKEGLAPKDLYYPIKRYINGLFFNDDYKISNFRVKSNIRIELP
ncbi:hypothetical protein [Marinifilum fragile]|uniref:hypothetical protein n=1 Tax=Marinifilum fragile TaxID=570161 RepID=UPI002AA88D89|nr:hypothetical protein [Marinifilum fragile]